MRWLVRSLVAVALLWAVLASPYVALYNLAKAVEARDLALISERVDFPALRLSLARQIASAYAKLVAPQKDAGAPTASIGVGAGAAFLDPLLEPYVSPQAIAELMRGGWGGLLRPEAAPGAKASGAELFDAGRFLSTANLRRLWDSTEWRGFRTFLVRLPQGGVEEPPQLQFRLADLTWRLSGIELPQELRDRLVRELAAAHQRK